VKAYEKSINELMEKISNEEKAVLTPIMDYLIELDYTLVKKGTKDSVLSFSSLAHNKAIARFGVREESSIPFFGLRFSACTEYSEKFANVIRERIESSNSRLAKCKSCRFCKGDKYVYTYTYPDGTTGASCGTFLLDIPDVTIDDVSEIKRLIKEQHEYFMKYAQSGPSQR
jgi:hypothetical protein